MLANTRQVKRQGDFIMSYLITHYCAKQRSAKTYWCKRRNGWLLTSAEYRKKKSILLLEYSVAKLWTCIWRLKPQVSDVIVVQDEKHIHAYYYDEIWDDVGYRDEMLEVPEFFGQLPLFQSEQEWIAFEKQKEAEKFFNMKEELYADPAIPEIDQNELRRQLDCCINELKNNKKSI